MNISKSNKPSMPPIADLKAPMRLWRRLQVRRGLRMLAKANRLISRAQDLKDIAARIIGRNAQAPSDLFDGGNKDR